MNLASAFRPKDNFEYPEPFVPTDVCASPGTIPQGDCRITLRQALLTLDATRRRAIGQILLLAAGFLVLVSISTSSVVLVNQSREDSSWVVHTVEVENQINALLLEIRRAESAIRGYLLTSEPLFLSEHETAVRGILTDADKLARLTGDNPVQIENNKELRPLVEARLRGTLARGVRATRITAAGPGGLRAAVARAPISL